MDKSVADLGEHDPDTLGVPNWREIDEFVPVKTKTVSKMATSTVGKIVQEYYAHGVVIVDVMDEDLDSDSLKILGHQLRLGDPYTPSQYTMSKTFAHQGISRMNTARQRDAGKQAHPSFHSTSGQLLHCDGTLEPIGSIRSTMLACHEPAYSGGATFFFNTTQALCELWDVDPSAASALLADDILIRTANINGIEGSHRGPAFALQDKDLITRASFSSTDTWAVAGNATGRDLARGISWLLEQASLPRGLFRRMRLAKNQIVVFANDKIAHGRDSFVNSEDHVRDVSRALFTIRPTKPGGTDATSK